MSIIAEARGFLQVFSDGSVKRFAPTIAQAASEEPKNGYHSKDIVIDPSKPITGRVFIPTTAAANEEAKLPILVYFHGGGFCIGSTTWQGYHVFLGGMATSAQAIVVSIDYRLAPENRLPTAYLDCYASLEWLGHQASGENSSWLKSADTSRVFLAGDSAGGNIVHNVAIHATRAKSTDLGLKIEGLLLIHPYFGSEERTEEEAASEGKEHDVAMNDMFWKLSLPEGSNRDYFGCNFEMNDVSGEEWTRFPRAVVHVASLDFLMERGVAYARFLREKGVREVELVRAQGEGHVYHVYDPESDATQSLQKHMGDFINSI